MPLAPRFWVLVAYSVLGLHREGGASGPPDILSNAHQRCPGIPGHLFLLLAIYLSVTYLLSSCCLLTARQSDATDREWNSTQLFTAMAICHTITELCQKPGNCEISSKGKVQDMYPAINNTEECMKCKL